MSSAMDEYLLLLEIGPAVMKSVPVFAIDLNDPNMKIVWGSTLFNEMFGYEAGELNGQSLDTLLKVQDREPHHRFFAEYSKAPNIRTMNAGVWVDGVKKDGSIIKIQVSLYPRAVGRRDMVIAHVADVTKAFAHISAVRPLEEGH